MGAQIFRLMNMLEESDLVTKSEDGNRTTYNYDFTGTDCGVTFVKKNED